MKKIAFAIAAATLLASQAFAQSPPGPADGTARSPQLPMGSAAKPAGDATPAPAPMGADGTPKGPSMSKNSGTTKADRKAARDARNSKMKAANKTGEIPSPSVNPKSY